jgi:two-component system, NarL family, sensor kinase
MLSNFIFLQARTDSALITGIVAGMFLFLLLSSAILYFAYQYQTKQRKHQKELMDTKNEFEKQLLQSQLEIQEQTFNSISQEIHDNVGQMLSLVKVQANIMAQKGTMDMELLEEIKETVGQAMTDLRDIAKCLSTDRIQLFDLSESIASQINRINKLGSIRASINIEGDERKLEDQKKLILFRIIQESLQNIVKHSGASTLGIRLKYLDSALVIEIMDNGTGFDVMEKTQKKTGLGFQNIMNRAALINCEVSISSNFGVGTTILLTMPYA